MIGGYRLGTVDQQIVDAVARLLEGVSQQDLREAILLALGSGETKEPSSRIIETNGSFGIEFFKSVHGSRSGGEAFQDIWKEAFQFVAQEPKLAPINEALWWAVRAGILVPGQPVGGD